MTTPPGLVTERLKLRGHTVEDFEQSFAMWSDEEVNRHIGGRPSTREEVWSRLIRYIGFWPALGFGYWVVTERASGKFIGEVGLADFRREIFPPLQDPEAGWVLVPGASGKGLATEALAAVLRWADSTLRYQSTCCIIAEENRASVRVAEKVGYAVASQAEYRGAQIVLHRRAVLANTAASS